MDLESQKVAGTANGAKAAAPPVAIRDLKKAELIPDDSSSPVKDDGDRWCIMFVAAVVMFNAYRSVLNPPGGFAATGEARLAIRNPAAFEGFSTAAMAAVMCSAAVILMLLCGRLLFIGARGFWWIIFTTLTISMISLMVAYSYYLQFFYY